MSLKGTLEYENVKSDLHQYYHNRNNLVQVALVTTSHELTYVTVESLQDLGTGREWYVRYFREFPNSVNIHNIFTHLAQTLHYSTLYALDYFVRSHFLIIVVIRPPPCV